MTMTFTNTRAASAQLHDLGTHLLAWVAQRFTAYIERRSCHSEFQALSAKTDAELAAIGLTREQIPEHVFRHWLWI